MTKLDLLALYKNNFESAQDLLNNYLSTRKNNEPDKKEVLFLTDVNVHAKHYIKLLEEMLSEVKQTN